MEYLTRPFGSMPGAPTFTAFTLLSTHLGLLPVALDSTESCGKDSEFMRASVLGAGPHHAAAVPFQGRIEDGPGVEQGHKDTALWERGQAAVPRCLL